jgi:hypothetical protein
VNRRRVLIAEPDPDVRELLELTVARLGYRPVDIGECDDAHAVLLEPGSEVGHSLLTRLGDEAPPVICLSIYPRELGLEPPQSVAYLMKPATTADIAEVLRDVFAVQPHI